MDIIGNNIAYVNTTAFKKSRANFAEIVRQALGDEGVPSVDNPRPEEGSGVMTVSIARMMEQGDLIPTGRDLDMSIDGQGFFKVIPIDSDDDQEYYTRDGHFFFNTDGILVNANGYEVEVEWNEEFDPAKYSTISVDEKGNIRGVRHSTDNEDQDSAEEPLGQIVLYAFPVPGNLFNKGNNLFMETETSGEPISEEPGTEGMGFIRQGYIERSNVDLATEMVGMIEAQRAYASNARTIQTADEMWERANNMRK